MSDVLAVLDAGSSSFEVSLFRAKTGGLDALVFTAGIGENGAVLRERVCHEADWRGVELDETANAAGSPCISLPASRAKAFVIPTNEALMIARHTERVRASAANEVPA
jgi:acetate kinase